MAKHTFAVAVDWNNDGTFVSAYGDITSYVQDIQIRAGTNDLLKSRVAGVGQATLIVNNKTRLFSPLNTSGALYGLLLPGRAVRIQVTVSGVTTTIFRGFTIAITPQSGTVSGTTASITCEDLMGYLQDHKLRMPLLENQTADDVLPHVINFALGAPAATATLTFTANPANNDTVTVNGTLYTFKTVIATVNDVLIGATLEDSAFNLTACVNGAEGSGTLYHATSTRPDSVTADFMPSLPTRATMWHNTSTILTGNALAILADTTIPFRHVWRQNTAANGNSFTNGFFIGAGTYTFYVVGRVDTDAGIIDWYLDNATSPFITGQDWYAAAAAASTQSGSITIAEGGWHRVKAIVNSKNAASTNFQIKLTKMYIKATND